MKFSKMKLEISCCLGFELLIGCIGFKERRFLDYIFLIAKATEKYCSK